jgi:hypothetical protein
MNCVAGLLFSNIMKVVCSFRTLGTVNTVISFTSRNTLIKETTGNLKSHILIAYQSINILYSMLLEWDKWWRNGLIQLRLHMLTKLSFCLTHTNFHQNPPCYSCAVCCQVGRGCDILCDHRIKWCLFFLYHFSMTCLFHMTLAYILP